MQYSKSTIALATAGALSLGAVPVIAQQVGDSAQTAQEAPDESTSPDTEADTDETERDQPRPGPRDGKAHVGRWFGGMVDQLTDDFAGELADELGLEPEEVADAIERIRERWMEDFAATLEEHRAEAGQRFGEHRAEAEERFEEHRAEAEERLGQLLDRAVEEGALSEGQADALRNLLADIDGFHPGMFGDLTDEQREAFDALRDYARERLPDGALPWLDQAA